MDPRPPDPEPGAGGPSDEGADDALRRLEQRLNRASEAAERLMAEAAGTVGRAAESVARAGGPPPAGWQVPGAEAQAGRGSSGDVELLTQILGSLRELIPPELQRRLADALRELLMAIRALIDWYLERAERKRTDPAEVQDIPIL